MTKIIFNHTSSASILRGGRGKSRAAFQLAKSQVIFAWVSTEAVIKRDYPYRCLAIAEFFLLCLLSPHYAQLAREHFSPMISFSLIISIKVLRVVLPQISVEKHVWKIGLFLYLFNRLIFISHFHMNFRQSISVDFFYIACDILLSKQRKLRKRRSVLKLSDAKHVWTCLLRVSECVCIYLLTVLRRSPRRLWLIYVRKIIYLP